MKNSFLLKSNAHISRPHSHNTMLSREGSCTITPEWFLTPHRAGKQAGAAPAHQCDGVLRRVCASRHQTNCSWKLNFAALHDL